MQSNSKELTQILTKFVESGWDTVSVPSQAWLDGKGGRDALTAAIRQADRECGSCGCEYDPLYKRALQLLDGKPAKASVPITNDFCPQAMFLYGTYKEDGTPNFALFCWLSYCWDGEMGVMACIGGSKLTRDRIRATGVFSANLVTEALLPLADYFGNTKGYSKDKMSVPVAVMQGAALNVPVLADSPVSFELEVKQTVELDGGEVFLCKIRNVLVNEELTDKSKTPEEHLRSILPASATCTTYFTWDGHTMGKWGEPMKAVKP